MKISACVIVKNEAENLPVWLESVKHYADEIIVVDTGSEDNSVELARQGGARVFHFAWRNDFAAAKNFALQQAHGDWIAFLDADEYFSPRCVTKVREQIAMAARRGHVGGIICRLLNIDKDENNRLISVVEQLRLFRNLQVFRYEGAVHEHLAQKALDEHLLEFNRELEIYHTGYSKKIMQQKSLRNLRIIEAKQAEGQSLPGEKGYLLDIYWSLQQYEKAEKCGYELLEEKEHYLGQGGINYFKLVNVLWQLQRPRAEIWRVLKEGLEKYPQEVYLLFLGGIISMEEKDYLQAEIYFARGMEQREINDRQENASVLLASAGKEANLLPRVYLHLGELAELRQQNGQALSHYLQGLKLYAYERRLLQALLRLVQKQPAVEIIQMLRTIYQPGQDDVWLASELEDLGGEVYLYFCRQAEKINGKQHETAGLYLAAGKAEAAAAEAATAYKRNCDLAVAAGRSLGAALAEHGVLDALLPQEYKTAWQQPAGQADATGTEQKVQRLQRELFPAKSLPLVSIMIPTYNRPEMFEQTLQSALAQTYDNFEVIVCDNSTDERTAELVEARYAAEPRLRYYRNREAKTKAENFAPFEQLAQGEYLQWLMDDDILAPQKLAKMMAVFARFADIKLVTSLRGVIDGQGNLAEQTYQDILQITGEVSRFDGKMLGRDLLVTQLNFIGEPSAVLFRRSDLANHYWRAESRGCETISDVAMWLELMEKGNAAVFREPLSYYRRHSQQEGQQPEVILLSRLEWYALIEEYHARKIFLQDEQDYQKALQRLWQEYAAGSLGGLAEQAPGMWPAYEELMQSVGKVLGEEN